MRRPLRRRTTRAGVAQCPRRAPPPTPAPRRRAWASTGSGLPARAAGGPSRARARPQCRTPDGAPPAGVTTKRPSAKAGRRRSGVAGSRLPKAAFRRARSVCRPRRATSGTSRAAGGLGHLRHEGVGGRGAGEARQHEHVEGRQRVGEGRPAVEAAACARDAGRHVGVAVGLQDAACGGKARRGGCRRGGARGASSPGRAPSGLACCCGRWPRHRGASRPPSGAAGRARQGRTSGPRAPRRCRRGG